MEIAVALLFLTVAVIVTFWPTASVVGVIEQEVMFGSVRAGTTPRKMMPPEFDPA